MLTFYISLQIRRIKLLMYKLWKSNVTFYIGVSMIILVIFIECNWEIINWNNCDFCFR